jgi:1-acyl-sn-glycerol-3-phosphate acyltransferase
MIARRAGVPLVPAVIDGAFEAWPRTKRIFCFAPITVIFGKPLEPKEQALSEAVARSLAQLQQKIRSVKFRC